MNNIKKTAFSPDKNLLSPLIKKTALPPDKTLLSRLEAAYYLDLSPHYLRTLLLKGRGPRFMQPAGKWGKILFKIEWLDEWVEDQSRKTKDDVK